MKAVENVGDHMTENAPVPALKLAGQPPKGKAANAKKNPQVRHVECALGPGLASRRLELHLQNMTCTLDVGSRIELRKLAITARNAEYNPQRFSGLVMRMREPRSTALIFSSGKMIITGVKTEEYSKMAAKKYCKIIKKVTDHDLRTFKDFKIQNMVATSEVGFPIRLEGLVYAHARFASYEPELFPGLIYRMQSPRLCILIFVSGKIVFTGAKNEADLKIALERIYPVLVEFKKEAIFNSRLPVSASATKKL
mmetsp:Transcript_12689/g.16673  ORF Transcript_12689/g.16673 Transcript_12689/m.16673 type:complete len:253 (+) Transcript_12689:166-924(+)|eukprot:CAMPEP_0117799738 /NCGR_PEP_ID=MMETSP0948-20121206/13980_1 /TAXON_ID=44440 /ORGANISM="Chattonella subsalsa, Strain CCMP2191" /LENGTH=252 /DNA_ID=CAMNT_0005631737 /DNA_START=84 /DNA_END=842 /DNA_ORIENTATION=-